MTPETYFVDRIASPGTAAAFSETANAYARNALKSGKDQGVMMNHFDTSINLNSLKNNSRSGWRGLRKHAPIACPPKMRRKDRTLTFELVNRAIDVRFL